MLGNILLCVKICQANVFAQAITSATLIGWRHTWQFLPIRLFTDDTVTTVARDSLLGVTHGMGK